MSGMVGQAFCVTEPSPTQSSTRDSAHLSWSMIRTPPFVCHEYHYLLTVRVWYLSSSRDAFNDFVRPETTKEIELHAPLIAITHYHAILPSVNHLVIYQLITLTNHFSFTVIDKPITLHFELLQKVSISRWINHFELIYYQTSHAGYPFAVLLLEMFRKTLYFRQTNRVYNILCCFRFIIQFAAELL